ncbi:MAG: tail fiber domain-containing protein [Bacteroidetes bacterium]|nr:tail fiber domain-containing protein [Bacteroidota bacterium]
MGIGTSLPSSKLTVQADVLPTGGSYTAVQVNNLIPSVDNNGLNYVGVEAQTIDFTWPPNPNSVFYFGGRFTATNATKANIGVEGTGQSTGSFQSPLNVGVKGVAYPSASGGAYGVQGISTGVGIAGYFLNSGGGTALVVDGHASISGTLFVSGPGWINGGTPIVSDQNLKHNIQDLDSALELVEQLHPKRYQYNTGEFPFLGLPQGERMGLLAQEVEQILPGLVQTATFPELRGSLGAMVHDSMLLKGIDYMELVPLLIGAIKEQNVRLDVLQAQVAQCCGTNPGLAQQGNGNQKNAAVPEDVQEQRLTIQPNPFTDRTTLGYYVPQAGRVSLQFSTSDGKPLGTLREEQAEAGAYTYEWNTSRLASGMYFCTYMLDGAVVVKRAVKVVR